MQVDAFFTLKKCLLTQLAMKRISSRGVPVLDIPHHEPILFPQDFKNNIHKFSDFFIHRISKINIPNFQRIDPKIFRDDFPNFSGKTFQDFQARHPQFFRIK